MAEKPKALVYPEQCWCAIHNKQTLALDNKLTIPSGESDETFLSLSGKASRFTLTLLDSETGNILSVNITGNDEPAYLFDKYKEAITARLLYRQNSNVKGEDSKPSPAYTERLRFGEFSGKTPAAILLEDATKADALQKHRDFLNSNLSKFPQNKVLINAIDEALSLQIDGELKNIEAASTSASFELFNEQFKVMKGGSIRAGILIVCEFDRQNPWKITLSNSTLSGDKVTDKKTSSISLSDKEMAGFMHAMMDNRHMFANMIFPNMWQSSYQHRWKPDWEAEQYDKVRKAISDMFEQIRPTIESLCKK